MKVGYGIVLSAVGALFVGGCNDTTLSSIPVAAEPPVAVIQGASAYSPLDTAVFDGSGSHDADGTIVSHTWALLARPAGSNSTLETPNAGQVELFVDFAGDYMLELTVTDDTGLTGTATMPFSAVPWQDIHVELAWDIDVSDVDLHLVDQASGGQFAVAPLDCYYSNKTPDWGDAGAANDPTLDIDDVDGFGPENINVAQPKDGAKYRVMVHYYSDDGVGGTNAIIRIYLNGTLQFEQVKFLSQTDKVWDVATIDWPTGAIEEIGTIFDSTGPI